MNVWNYFGPLYATAHFGFGQVPPPEMRCRFAPHLTSSPRLVTAPRRTTSPRLKRVGPGQLRLSYLYCLWAAVGAVAAVAAARASRVHYERSILLFGQVRKYLIICALSYNPPIQTSI
jgi:hypothetical protein